MGEDRVRNVAVIVPAFNEEARIASVLHAVLQSKLATEIIVVSDGSRDRTAEVARKIGGVTVIDLKTNRGKGGAMLAGVRASTAPTVMFVDADLSGLLPSHIDQIILPVVTGNYDMCVGIFRGGKVWSDAAHSFSPYLSGQRAMRRDLFLSVPELSELRMGVEAAITVAAKRRKARVIKVVLRGVSNCHKEQKMGLVKGIAARTMMFKEITEAVVRTRRRRPQPHIDWGKKRWGKRRRYP